MRSHKLSLRRAIAVVLFFALSLSGVLSLPAAFAAGNPKDNQVVGQLTATGAVTVNDKKALNGTTIFNNSRLSVACAGGNRAVVNLGRLGRVELTPGSQMVLRYSEGLISGELLMGKIMVNAPVGVKVAINTPEGVSAADGKEAAAMAINTQRGVRCVPMVAQSPMRQLALGSGGLAALLLGTGGAAAGAVVAATSNNNSSNVIP